MSTHHAHPAGAAPVLSLDLGKTSCRAAIIRGTQVLASASGAGAPGLAEHNGLRLSFDAITATVAQIDPIALDQITSIGVGAAGVESEPAAGQELASLLRARLGVPVAVVTDALSGHAGAFNGGDGKFLIVGTGAVLYSVGPRGVNLVDGWGPWLGDEGSGRWIGQMGIIAALRAYDNRGPHTALLEDIREFAGEATGLPAWVTRDGMPARQLGSFAPVVLARSESGDTEARRIVSEAADHLARTCVSTDPETSSVCVAGGISENAHFYRILADKLASHDYQLARPRWDALIGAALITASDSLRYEERIVRA